MSLLEHDPSAPRLPGLLPDGPVVSSHTVDRLLALLFVAEAPATARALAQALGLTEGQAEQGLEVLEDRLRGSGPLQLVRLAGGYQLATKPDFSGDIEAFLRPQRPRLSRSLMETLAIIAYRQPITLAEIDAIRGVQSDHSVRSLAERRLVREVGRKQAPGRPVLYGTSEQFLHQFNLNDLSQLPSLETDALLLPAEA